MKRVFAVFPVIVLLFTADVYADWIFDEIRATARKRVRGRELMALEDKYRGRIISAEGYVLEVKESSIINGLEVHLMEDKEKVKNSIIGDVSIEIPAASPNFETAGKLSKGQKVSFKGRLDDIFGKTIYIRGSAKITPE